MITRRLWGALDKPPAFHPLYQRIFNQYAPRKSKRGGLRLLLFYGLFCCSLTYFQLIGWLPLLLLIIALLGNTVYGAWWAVQISGVIAAEHEKNTYDLLRLSPVGTLAISWVIFTALINRTAVFVRVYFVVRLVALTLMISLSIACLLPLISLLSIPQSDLSTLDLLSFGVYGLAVSVAFFADHIQSFVLGSLVGMTAPAAVRSRAEARFWAAAIFLLYQLVAYTLSALFILALLLALYLLNVSLWISHIGVSAAAIVFFIIMRDGLIRFYCRQMLEILNADLVELDFSNMPAV